MTTLDLRAIARALGGEVSGRRVLAPGPQHSLKDRSLCVSLAPAPANYEIHSERLRGRAAHSTVDALMYSLRRGVGDLTKPDTLRRISELDKTQIGDVCERCTRFQPHIAPAWSRDEIVTLIEVWARLRGVRINQCQ